MRLLHLSDLHLGKQLHGYRLLEDQAHILDEIVGQAKELAPDALVIAGDVYDKPVPPAEAVQLFDRFLTQMADVVPVICVIAGNHDSGARLDFGKDLLAGHHIYMAGEAPAKEKEHLRRVTLRDEWGEADLWLLPFVKPAYVRHFLGEEADTYENTVRLLLEKEEIDRSRRNILVAHQFFVSGGAGGDDPTGSLRLSDSEVRQVGGLDQISVGILSDFDYVALGHLHRPQQVGRKTAVYCGTPLKYSVSEADDVKQLHVVDIGKKGEVRITRIPLHPLRDVRILAGSLEELLCQAELETKKQRDDYVSVQLTDETIPYEPRRRLEACYPHILEIKMGRSAIQRMVEEQQIGGDIDERSPIEVFGCFFARMNGRAMTKDEEKVMRDVMDKVESAGH